MTEINPIASSILQAPLVQQQQTSEKTRQARMAQLQEKIATANQDDEDESQHKVENSEELTPADDDHSNPQGRREKPKSRKNHADEEEDGENPHIDMKA
jgi:hypothetical protein